WWEPVPVAGWFATNLDPPAAPVALGLIGVGVRSVCFDAAIVLVVPPVSLQGAPTGGARQVPSFRMRN
ncbi:MAG: hypothetical protein AVDCRST_MAG73-3149, partial [uncultured Thermomicrobiales bacterium]